MKKVLIILLVLVLGGIAIGIFLYNKPHAKVENAKGISINAVDLAKAFSTDETKADAQYLNKAIVVTGTVSEVDKNQDGGTMIVLKTNDPVAGVQCAMRDKGVSAEKGRDVTIEGFCSGNDITGVSLTGCILK
ncbi:MAG TPA: hypothetical protein VN721_09405 [Flavipsychrobacter sp.]|nr:hypothetical protein [Flavipsychrobacter sp.]